MRSHVFIVLLCSVLVMSCGESLTQEQALRIDAAWARPAAVITEPVASGPDQTPRVGPSAIYLTLQNRGQIADRLLQVRTEVAGIVEIHQSTEENGVMRMHRREYVEVPAGETVLFEPGGYHIMLMDLKHPLQIGDSFPVTLVFEQSGLETVQVVVREY